MSTNPISIRAFQPGEAAAFRAIRLEALATNPEAFATALAEEEGQPMEFFADRIADGAVFGAFDGDRAVGMAAFQVGTAIKSLHRGSVWGMYVRPDVRGGGAGGALLQAVIDHARMRVEILYLGVVTENGPARKLYERLGFVECGFHRHSLKMGERYYDEVIMSLHFADERPPFIDAPIH